ncbi:5311_t:CDS:2 [Ambispora leptoticha]|uniref:Elongation factor Ts, mitochondrial n=1 Tax=Ambispora leptoticha TaxID=144679 RepID=A0A9N8ZSE9_9GLOM|nr:5311_t:CDS:2 [Ambispora leptoticha]
MRRVFVLGLAKQRVYFNNINNINFTIHTFSTKADLQLLQKLRQETEVSISKAKEALVINKNDYEKALSWVLEDAKTSGAIKAEKLRGRVAKEGLVGVVVNNIDKKDLSSQRGAIVEVNCETDFVSRNEMFKQFVAQIASTSLLLPVEDLSYDNELPTIQNIPLDLLKSSPLLPLPSITSYDHKFNTVEQSVGELIGKLGENITLRRVAVVNMKDSCKENSRSIVTTGGYVHGGDELTGKIGGLILLQSSGETSQQQQSSQIISKLAKNLARQVVGLNPKYINDDENNIILDEEVEDRESFLNENVLMRQASLWGGGLIRDVMKQTELNSKLQLKVLNFIRWECGEGIEKQDTNFAAEVMKQAGLT